MRPLPDIELQARLLREMIEVTEKKRKLEAALSAVDVRAQLLMDSAVRKDIEPYKNRHMVAGIANVPMMNTDKDADEQVQDDESRKGQWLYLSTMSRSDS
jgi:hypothetical protein